MPTSNNEDSSSSEEDTGSFQFGHDLKPSTEEKLRDLSEQEQDRLLDMVRLEPTSNSELKNKWDLASGSAVHHYIESELKSFYYRDDESYICVTEKAKDFVRENSGLNQYVTKESDSIEDVSENIRNRDLLMDLVSVAQSIGHLPDEREIQTHSKYSPNRFRDEFGGLFEACEKAGIVRDSVTKDDYTAAREKKERERESEAEEEEESEFPPSGPSEAELIEELQWVDEVVEGVPYPADMNDSGAFTTHDYQEKFGSWDDALDAAGIDKEEQLLLDMQAVVDEVGEDMTAPQMNEHGRYSSTMAARYFGSWTEAKERFQEWNNEQEEESESSEEFDNMVNDRLDDILG
ncbi:DUF5797 family protein [Halobacteria archaeon AArc-curdl1]|uniref:DUF5797 family protein n=1 Tax=Natronosalvus hydrolyticus TaxID=2979988 RepID=A0AAP3E7V6_9EURY|nr:DUF5797 family protein [Halobacteria archaeon AArc-curdl1]